MPTATALIAATSSPMTVGTTRRPTSTPGAAAPCCSDGHISTTSVRSMNDCSSTTRTSISPNAGLRTRGAIDTCPGSEVRHVHNASSGHGSAFKQWHDDRNHLVVLARHAPPAETLRASAHFLATTGSYLGRDVVRPVLAARRPAPTDRGPAAVGVRIVPATPARNAAGPPSRRTALTYLARVVRRRIVVEGRVQGVGFRVSCARRAQAAGLGGMVRNLPDGRVEAVFEGTPESVDALVSWCAHGPASAQVRRVRVVDEDPLGETVFRVT